jgi:hypothetical protein
MNIGAANLTLILLLGSGPALCSAEDFSADIVYLPSASAGAAAPKQNSSRIFVSNEKMRLETGGPAQTILLINGPEQGVVALLPATKEYEPLAGGPAEYFQVRDAENACPDWQKAAAQKIDCEKAGHELLDGRQTVKYKNRGVSGDSISAVWIDLDLKFVVKWKGAGTGVELHNIHQARQPAELFEVPQDYQIAKPRKGTNKGFSHRGS